MKNKKPLRAVKEVKWRWDWGVYVPFCPYCDEPAYDRDKCYACGGSYKWVDGEHQPTVVTKGEYTITQATNNHITIAKNGRVEMHGQCPKKMTEAELLEMIDHHVEFCRKLEGHR